MAQGRHNRIVHAHDCTLPATPESIARARRVVARWLEERGCAKHVVDNARLAVSEAFTNAVLHGYVDRDVANVELMVSGHGDEVRVVVRDHGRGMRPRPDSPGSGFGLKIVEQVTTRFEVCETPGGGTELSMAFPATG